MSRKPVSSEKRKTVFQVLMNVEQQRLVETLGVGKSFSEKALSLIKKGIDQETLLVRYDNDEQRNCASPTVVNKGAFQVYNSMYGVGINDLPKRGKKTSEAVYMKEVLVPHMEQQGYRVQLIEEEGLLDLWACSQVETVVGTCATCEHLKKIADMIALAQGKGVRNDF